MLGIVAGTSLRKSDMFKHLAETPVDTPYGRVTLATTPADSDHPKVAFCQRHDREGEFVPPHNVNYHGNIWAMKAVGVERMVGIYSIGGLKHGPGTLYVPDDYLNPWAPVTYSERGDDCKFITPQLDRKLHDQLVEIAKASEAIDNDKIVEEGVYIQTVGPRFETRAEVRYLAMIGDVLGMTGASEATLAQELDMPFAMLGMIDNWAHGLSPDELTLESFRAAVEDNRDRMERFVRDIIAKLAPK